MYIVGLIIAFGAGFFVGGRIVDRRFDGLLDRLVNMAPEQQRSFMDEHRRKFPI